MNGFQLGTTKMEWNINQVCLKTESFSFIKRNYYYIYITRIGTLCNPRTNTELRADYERNLDFARVRA